MKPRAYRDVKAQIRKIAAVTGVQMTDPRLIEYTNLATEELMNEGDWPGVVDRYYFVTQNHHIILPSFLDRIMGVAINDRPYSMRSPWFEFVEYGPGPQNDNNCKWVDNVIDRDETAIQTVFPSESDGPWTLYVKAQYDESVDGVNPTIVVQGRASNDTNVRTFYGTSYMWGETLEIDPVAPYTTYGTAVFTDVTAVIKPETKGYIELWATNGTAEDDVMLAKYGPDETYPSYHSYFLPALKECLYGIVYCWAGCGSCGDDPENIEDRDLRVLVRGRKRFIPIINDNDQLIISNLPALMSMIQAVVKREQSDLQGYAMYKLQAIDIMNKEAKSYRGAIKTPPITVATGSAVGFMPFVR